MINQVVAQRYEVLEKVGESALFAVFKARDKSGNRMVAVKAVNPLYAANPNLMDGLTAGMNAAKSLSHPNITYVQEAGTEGDTPYFVTEFVRGINLKERIRRIAPFTLSIAIDFACAVAEGLHYAHSVGLPHGDLRPQNLIISPEGTLKITDFGVMRGIAASGKAQEEILRSAAPYHAPELSMTLPGTAAGDIYALGAILHEMLTGTPLYSGSTPEDIADQHAFAAIPSPRSSNPGVPLAVVGILLKSLQKKPEDRYTNAADLLNDLKSVRDALRFGKSLSWSPIDPKDMERMAAAPPRPVPPKVVAPKVVPPPPPPKPKPKPAPPPVLEPVADVAASSQVLPMPNQNALRARDERVALWLRIPIYGITLVIFGCLVVLGGIWSSHWVVAPPVPAPKMLGKSIDDVRALADRLEIKLIEHAEYNEKKRNIVYKTDKAENAPLRKKQTVNVWFSRGPEYVKVPKVVGLSRDDAEKKLQEAGLKVGRIEKKSSETMPVDNVLSQSGQVQAMHDSAIDLVVSDGPKVTPLEDNPASAPDSPAPPPAAPDPDTVEHTFKAHITVNRDGAGTRQVRIEYDDSIGTHEFANEPHSAGDRIQIDFHYTGKLTEMRVYYDEVPKKTFSEAELAKIIKGQKS